MTAPLLYWLLSVGRVRVRIGSTWVTATDVRPRVGAAWAASGEARTRIGGEWV